MTWDACDCPDALAFRALLNSPTGEALDRLASTLAARKLRAMSADLSDAADWSKPWNPARRDQYDTPPLTADEIRERTRASWAATYSDMR